MRSKNYLIIFLIGLQVFLLAIPIKAQYLDWVGTFGGGNSALSGNSIAVDKSGNVYTVCTFGGTADFDPDTSTFNLTASVGNWVICKLDNQGNFIWARHFVSSTHQPINTIALDDSANIYMTGGFNGTVDFDPSAGIYNLTASLRMSLFICKLDSAGNFIWAEKTGNSTFTCRANWVSTDPLGNVIVTGTFGDSIDFDMGSSSYYLSSPGNEDAFVLKLDNNGNFIWADKFGGPSNDNCFQSSIDTIGNIYITGSFSDSADFDPGPLTNYLFSNGQVDAFICKLDLGGNLIWAHQVGGALTDVGSTLTVDYHGAVYVAGSFRDTIDFDPGPGNYFIHSMGVADIFILSLDSAGHFNWVRQFSNNFTLPNPSQIIFDKNENLILCGTFAAQVDFDPGIGTYILNAYGWDHAYICKINVSGHFLWAIQLEGNPSLNHHSYIHSLYADSLGSIYCTSNFYGTIDFDPQVGVYNLTSTDDAYVLKLSETPNAVTDFNNVHAEIEIFPNPGSKVLTIYSAHLKMEGVILYGLLGEKLLEYGKLGGLMEYRLAVDYLPAGLYFIQVMTNGGVVTKKWVKG